MATPRNIDDPDVGTREEDWPDPDMDLDTSEGREAMERAEVAMAATIARSIRQRHQQLESAYPAIPQALYTKAQHHQDQLTRDERTLLLSRGDVIGKALAHPESLTPEETHQALLWPPPDVVRANIRRATGGVLSTPGELYAKAKDALDRHQLETVLNDNETILLSRSFHAPDDNNFTSSARMTALSGSVPGNAQPTALVMSRLGMEMRVFQAAALCQSQRMAAAAFHPPQPPPAPPPPAPLRTDLYSAGPWPPTAQPRDPIALFYADNPRLGGYGVHPAWAALPEDQRDAYRARSETLRSEAWAADGGSETALPLVAGGREERRPGGEGSAAAAAAAAARGSGGGERLTAASRRPGIVTGLRVFRREVEAAARAEGVEFAEVLRRWEGLEKGRCEEYEARGRVETAAVQAAWRQGRRG